VTGGDGLEVGLEISEGFNFGDPGVVDQQCDAASSLAGVFRVGKSKPSVALK
jgi:hypothetical protein